MFLFKYSNLIQAFSPITTVNPVQERNSLSVITIGHIVEFHHVSTTPFQSIKYWYLVFN